MTVYVASTTAPVNIATLKYWGKRDANLNLPTNSSISVTLAQDDLRTLTSAATSERFEKDTLWLNGKEESLANKRTQDCLQDLRDLRHQLESQNPSLPKLSQWKLHIVSENNFPTAAGLASSAAGFAALVVAIAKLYKLPQDMSELSRIARKGSGSACRSLFGGFVAWEMGDAEDGLDSMAVEVLPLEAWPEMKAAILVVSDVKKDTSSTQGMQLTVATSDLFKERVTTVVPKRFVEMKEAIVNRDFTKFAEMTMKDSNSFHATCLDSYPPIFYINDTSKKVIRLVHSINAFFNETVVAYTFDAGPNAVLYYLEKNENKLFAFLYKLLHQVDGWEPKYNKDQLNGFINTFENEYKDKIEFFIDPELYQGITRIILTRVGPGPQDSEKSLIDQSTGLPK
ncbi:similar to Saccharomyces cerevisiae YNR043W MVD1 Mevalonate pyrophosphate decarboxylase, essential enzyme involved in the biosynthesis of isoprenoids and sterols, including ergosterol [Maudiozyma barnettii]|uniref:Diphosphomevalonate decarboxylase n=1 Tax=Maudiozyma barnettii TaxID=61262 RepID=A0A8H2VHD3_9SACH|nr:diphosphomevalonate decarboxylase MVD1 [Kazachstania barnettii]CAB4255430.1 similar to Saccharomyces cerevisiae YNR043W MVD1 Mevalonate pyrophosphate decarboxylase, essential enzyme involved in the biosynthesis of isoprenoids and sterols, including ergosterol [Kazachstania barnettii]CAD1783863.1 similar to Saccharomyces cerevisiae YNR043W MVD1 Mevalonate pyrophosphate decarboxylase, essential enzyme involved in the biosynthesis of isoprenoids and sterols, including ergosterol [Kazachstania bar